MKPSRYKAFLEYLVENIAGLNHSIPVVKEEHFKEKVKNLKTSQMPVLVGVIPSYDGGGPDPDNYNDMESHLLFVLTKRDPSDRTDANEISDFDLGYEIAQAIKNLIIENTHCSLPFHADLEHTVVKSFHGDPEFNFLGYNGYSLSFRVEVYQ